VPYVFGLSLFLPLEEKTFFYKGTTMSELLLLLVIKGTDRPDSISPESGTKGQP
jgi:hypothetical protein